MAGSYRCRSARRATFRWVCIIFCSQTAWLTGASAQSDNNARAIADFGVAKSDPIDRGFLFLSGRYIEAPYVVERRGLDVFVNDIRVEKGPEWPRVDPRVKDDPGDPPPGASLFGAPPDGVDPRTTYWRRKWAYIAQHNDFDAALAKMAVAYRKSNEVTSVALDAASTGRVIIVTKDGRTVGIRLTAPNARSLKWPPDKEKLLAGAEDVRARWERRLRADMLQSMIPGGRMSVGAGRALEMLDDILAQPDRAAAREALVQKGVLRADDNDFAVLVTQFQASPQLARRVAELRVRIDDKQVKMATNSILREMRAALDDGAIGREVFPPTAPEDGAYTDSAQSQPALLATAAEATNDVKQRRCPTWAIVLVLVAVVAGGTWAVARRRQRSRRS